MLLALKIVIKPSCIPDRWLELLSSGHFLLTLENNTEINWNHLPFCLCWEQEWRLLCCTQKETELLSGVIATKFSPTEVLVLNWGFLLEENYGFKRVTSHLVLSTAVSFTMIKVCSLKRLFWCCLFITKLYFWLYVCSTVWGLWNFAIAFYSVPDNLSVFDFVWNLISSDKIPAMAWLWVIALVCGECELQLAVFACFHFSLQSQGQCEVFSEQCWPHGLHGLHSCQGAVP